MLAIDCSKIEYRPTGVGRILLNILRRWPGDFPARLYFRRHVPDHDFLHTQCFSLVNTSLLSSWSSSLSKIDPLWRHFVLARALKRDKISLLFEPFYIPLLTWPPEKTVVMIHDISYKRHPEWFSRRSQLSWFPDRLVKRVRHILTISEFSKREIMDYYGIPEGRITVTPLAADEQFRPAGPDFVPPLPEPYFLFWGDLNTRRHPREMLNAFAQCQIANTKYRIRFVLVGRDITNPPQHIDRLVAEVNEMLGREAIKRVVYPSDDELVRLIQGALAVIYLSDYEGFGLPVLEAMACGVPVITSRTSSLPEAGGEAAHYVKDNGDVDEIAGAMKRLSEDAALRENLRTQGLAEARKFSWRNTAETTIRILRELMV